ncbi:23S rRNA pseudouridine1911/1915/1917 synthase [Paenibacillus sp. UNCCL117]|uniref:RluA family pseudouridine synthase n=1 Tax=unclassified Paenibacillus TaxID=185978 RepID=UPI00088A25C8|nr:MULTISPECIES: RluA family pseudouridine synthase [unclassified Paenibacillus]SDD24922.1 23S rRNA pseudouridine1911/1915/1917 synthase [Paenibacillus sp. cl123]SFW41372.1 23S rRNA pseudouridine1911/1915/1917 synthase [Paenibacillus sp. UNCCL117]
MSWLRKGEWLEWRHRTDISSRDEAREAAAALVGDKWSRTLLHSEGLLWQGSRLRLKLFPLEESQYGAAEAGQSGEPEEAELLYEDDFCLVAGKPAGMKVHPTEPLETGALSQAVSRRLYLEGRPCRPRHIHRLDEDTTGPVLFAKYAWVQSRLDVWMSEKRIERTYVAIVQGQVARAKGRIDAAIGRDRHHPTRRRVSPSGDRAVTRYERLQVWKHATLVRLTLETGRTHQIRVHMSHLGHPLLGDVLYGGPADPIARQALHGERLVFPHPLTGETIAVDAPWPEDLTALQARLEK